MWVISGQIFSNFGFSSKNLSKFWLNLDVDGIERFEQFSADSTSFDWIKVTQLFSTVRPIHCHLEFATYSNCFFASVFLLFSAQCPPGV